MFKTSHLPAVIFGAVTTMIVQSQPVFASLSADQIGDIAENITVRILTPASPGSGIIIGRNGNTYTVLTARHVIAGIVAGEESDVETSDGELHAINTRNIKTFGEKWDLAVVEFTSDKSYQVGQMGDSSTLKRGQMVYVAGFPIATAAMNISLLNFTKGNLTAVTSRAFENGYGLVYDNTTLPGMSGGVVLDENGKIVGVHGRADAENSKATDDPNIRMKTGFNLAIPINSYLGLTNQLAFNPNINQNSALKADDYYTQANQKYDQKDYQGAISLFNQAIALNSNYDKAYNDRGNTYFYLQKYQEAIADYTQAIAINPQYAEAYYNRGTTYYYLQKYPEAIANFNRAIAINPQSAEAYYNRGTAYYDLQKYPEAIADFNRAIAINPQYADAYYNRGTTYYYLQKYPEAIADFNRAIAINPQYADAYYNRGVTYADLQKYQEAIADYTQAIAINPQYADAYYNRGTAYYDLQKYPEAIADYTQAIAINPQLDLAYNNRGWAYNNLQKYPEAIADYNRAIAINPQYADAYNNRGITYYNLQKYPEARRDFNQAANLFLQQGNNTGYQQTMNNLNQLPR